MVTKFYAEIAQLPQISDQEMCTAMQQLSVRQNEEFDTMVALKELYIYVSKYRDQVNEYTLYAFLRCITKSTNNFFQILDALDMDISCKKMHLSHKLENVACTLEGEESSNCWQSIDFLSADLDLDFNNVAQHAGDGFSYSNNLTNSHENILQPPINPQNTHHNHHSSSLLHHTNNYAHNLMDSFEDKNGFNKFF